VTTDPRYSRQGTKHQVVWPDGVVILADAPGQDKPLELKAQVVATTPQGRLLNRKTIDLLNQYHVERFLDDCQTFDGAYKYAAPLQYLTEHIVQALALDSAQTPGTRHAADPWPVPTPLPQALLPVQPFDAALLPSLLRPWVTDIAERMQCPMDFPAIPAMVEVGALIGRQLGIRPKRHDDWLVLGNIWGAVVGRSGVMKSPAIAEPQRPLVALEVAAKQHHEAVLQQYEADQLVARASLKEAEKAIVKALREGQDASALARKAVSHPADLPARQRYLANDCTVEKLGELLAENPRGILVFRDELMGFLRGLDREGHESARAFFLEAWNGTGRFTYDRIGRGTIDIEAACISILGGIQPGPLTHYIGAAMREGLGDDGLLQRFQLLVWPDIAPGWTNVDRWPSTEARHNVTALFAWLDTLDRAEVQAEGGDDGTIPWLRFDAAAQREFDLWRASLEQKVRSGLEHPALESHLAKYRSLVPALALICHLCDQRGGRVPKAAVLRACAWAEYLESHARRVYGYATDLPHNAARELDRHILNGDLGPQFTARDVYLKGWGMLDRDATHLALEHLADLDRIRQERLDTGGRPKVIWTVNPRLLEDKKISEA
jgi:hypothetical protein